MEKAYGPGLLGTLFRSAMDLAGWREPGSAPDAPVQGMGFHAQSPADEGYQMSGEWTWGAVMAAVALAEDAQAPGREDPAEAAALLDQARSLIRGLERHASHDYGASGQPGSWDAVAGLYASSRAWIPWGWHANPCPSMSATAWSFLVSSGFDPFELGGGHHQATIRALGLGGAEGAP
jgi:hypothetical protein